MINPLVYHDKDIDSTWEWDSETKTKAQGLLHSLKSISFISSFISVKNILEILKPLAVKLQKKDQDVVEAYNLIDSAISNVMHLRQSIDTEFHDWFVQIEELANEVGGEVCVPKIAGRQTQSKLWYKFYDSRTLLSCEYSPTFFRSCSARNYYAISL